VPPKETTVMMMDEDTEPSSADVVLIDDRESDPSTKKRKTSSQSSKTERRLELEKAAARNFSSWSSEFPGIFKLITAQETEDDLLRIECNVCEVCPN
jgi:hypothetical protein